VSRFIVVNVESMLLGYGWELAATTASGLAASGGGSTTPGGQVINLNLSAPDLILLNNLGFPPFPGGMTISVTSAVLLPNLSIQMAVIDPTHQDGCRLSALCQLGFN
jgi:hypothetical protein